MRLFQMRVKYPIKKQPSKNKLIPIDLKKRLHDRYFAYMYHRDQTNYANTTVVYVFFIDLRNYALCLSINC